MADIVAGREPAFVPVLVAPDEEERRLLSRALRVVINAGWYKGAVVLRLLHGEAPELVSWDIGVPVCNRRGTAKLTS